MSVTSDVILPAQPADGSFEVRPLGGSGYTSPSQLSVVNVRSASDASGGFNQIGITLDDVFSNLVNILQIAIAGAAADVAFKAQLAVLATGESLQVTGDANFSSVGLNNQTSALWSPPPLIVNTEAELRVTVPNVNGETLVATSWIYQFDKRAQEFTPLEILLASVPRGTSLN